MKSEIQQSMGFSKRILKFSLALQVMLLMASCIFVGIIIIPLHIDPVVFSLEFTGLFIVDFILMCFIAAIICFYNQKDVNTILAFASMIFVGMVIAIVSFVYLRLSFILLKDFET